MYYEQILSNMLNKLPDNYDKRQGSILYDILAPCALELAAYYQTLEAYLDLSFVETSTGSYLEKRTAELGIKREPAEPMIITAEIKDMDGNLMSGLIGKRFSANGLVFKASEIDDENPNITRLECEQPGNVGFLLTDELIPLDYIAGFGSIEVKNITLGKNAETDDELRKKYISIVNHPAYGGNAADYKQKTKELEGVGGVNVIPTWNGGGTVKLVIINSSYKKPDAALISSVQEAIDPLDNQGTGVGIAPIGHVVKVEGIQEVSLKIGTILALQPDWKLDDIKESVTEVVDNYFTELAALWEDTENLVVRKSQIETRLLDLEGVADVFNTTIQDKEENYTLGKFDIPVREGEITIEEKTD